MTLPRNLAWVPSRTMRQSVLRPFGLDERTLVRRELKRAGVDEDIRYPSDPMVDGPPALLYDSRERPMRRRAGFR